MQTGVDEVAEGVDLMLKVLLGRSVHLLEFLNVKARSMYFGRVDVAGADRSSLSLVEDVGASHASTYMNEHRLVQLLN